MKQSLASRTGHSAWLVPVIHTSFLLIGIINTLLGPILPILSVRWQLDDTEAGSLFFVQSVGAIVGSALTGPIIRRFGFQTILISGFCLMSVSTVLLGFSPWRLGMICIAGIGLSLGLTIPTINVLISDINSTRRAAALNILNLAWGVGAVFGPLVIPILSRRLSLSLALIFVAIPIAIIAPLVPNSPAETKQSDLGGTAVEAWLTPYFLLTAAFVFINVGTESAMGGWIASYVERLSPSSELAWGAATSLFWGGILVGRALAPFVLKQMREVTMVLAGILIVVVGLLVVLLNSRPGLILLGVAMAGLGLAPVFPTTIALFTARLGKAAARLTGTLFIFAALGSAVFPWVVGLVSTRYQDLQVGLIVPLVGALLMMVVQVAIMTMSRRIPPNISSGS
jgi:MFS transporter, FHS family, glucose/mannose:H+ symporter